MDLRSIHFIREILLNDYRGRPIPTMQFSYDNASFLNPTFRVAPLSDEGQVREAYQKLGGSRGEGKQTGTTVIIPNRSWFARFWAISADQVRVVASVGPKRGSQT